MILLRMLKSIDPAGPAAFDPFAFLGAPGVFGVFGALEAVAALETVLFFFDSLSPMLLSSKYKNNRPCEYNLLYIIFTDFEIDNRKIIIAFATVQP